jgi:hypothetical protein
MTTGAGRTTRLASTRLFHRPMPVPSAIALALLKVRASRVGRATPELRGAQRRALPEPAPVPGISLIGRRDGFSCERLRGSQACARGDRGSAPRRGARGLAVARMLAARCSLPAFEPRRARSVGCARPLERRRALSVRRVSFRRNGGARRAPWANARSRTGSGRRAARELFEGSSARGLDGAASASAKFGTRTAKPKGDVPVHVSSFS